MRWDASRLRVGVMDRLDELSTSWDLLRRAHGGPADARRLAQEMLLRRYTPAVFRYLRVAAGDDALAEDLFQQFALCFVKGGLAGADESRGRFRDYVRKTLSNLVTTHHRRARPTAELPHDLPAPADDFLTLWRDQIVGRAFEALLDHERRTGQPLHLVLRLKIDSPGARSDELARAASSRLGRELSPSWYRNRLHVARQCFGDLLVEEVARSLIDPDDDELAAELAELGLLESCRDALDRRWAR